MRELQQLKKVRLGQNPDPNLEKNPLSLTIQSDVISTAIRVPKERFSGTSDPTDHAATFESHMDFYGALEEWHGPGIIHFLLNLLRTLNALRSCS